MNAKSLSSGQPSSSQPSSPVLITDDMMIYTNQKEICIYKYRHHEIVTIAHVCLNDTKVATDSRYYMLDKQYTL